VPGAGTGPVLHKVTASRPSRGHKISKYITARCGTGAVFLPLPGPQAQCPGYTVTGHAAGHCTTLPVCDAGGARRQKGLEASLRGLGGPGALNRPSRALGAARQWVYGAPLTIDTGPARPVTRERVLIGHVASRPRVLRTLLFLTRIGSRPGISTLLIN